MTKPEQYVLPLFDNNLYQVDNFISSISNQVAYNAINNWSVSWGSKPYEKVVLIYGPPSSGKTYLTKIWQNMAKAFLITKNIDLLTEEIIKKNDNFIIEDIEFWDEKKLLHCFNLISEYRKYLLITTGSILNNFLLQDLLSRINSIMRLEIKQPDDELMKILIFKHFSDHSIIVHDQVIKYLLINLPRRFDQMIKSLKFITHFALVHKRTVTVSLIKIALNASPA